MDRKKILVADDDPAILKLYCDLLYRQGYEPVRATNGREALDGIRKEKPDLAIIDLKMPEIDGVDLLRQLARSGDPTPIVVCTGHGELKGDVDISYGEVRAFLNKPVRLEELSRAIGKALGVSEPVGKLLERYGLVTEEQLRKALARQSRQGNDKKIGEILIEMGILDEEQWLNFIARLPGVARISLRKYVIDPDIVQLIPEDFCRRVELVAIDKYGSVMTVAMAYPHNLQAIHQLSKEVGLRVKAVMATRQEIMEVLDSVFGEQANAAPWTIYAVSE